MTIMCKKGKRENRAKRRRKQEQREKKSRIGKPVKGMARKGIIVSGEGLPANDGSRERGEGRSGEGQGKYEY